MIPAPVVWSTLLIAGPLLAALVALSDRARTIRLGLAFGSGAALAGSAGLWREVVATGPMRHLVGGWGAPLGIELGADGLSVAMLTLTAVVGSAVSLHATAYFGDPPTSGVRQAPSGRGARFFAPLWLLLWAALNGVYLSRDLFNLYVTLEILGLSAAAMVTLAVTSKAMTAGLRYLLVSLVGSLLFVFGVALLYATYGVLSLEGLAAAAPAGPVPATALAAMTVGLSMKTALFPFHGWLPPAHSSAPAPGSALLSGLVVKASFYVLLRLWVDVYAASAQAALLMLGILGGAAILWGSVLALRQTRLKRLVAYSTVAQLGYLLVMFPLLMAPGEEGVTGGHLQAQAQAWSGGIYHALSHGVAKAAMFLAAGCLSYAVSRDSLASLSGLAHRLPLSFFAFGLAGMSLAGIPPSGGFVSKWLMMRSAMDSGRWGWALLMALGGILTAVYVLLVVRRGLGPGTGPPSGTEPRLAAATVPDPGTEDAPQSRPGSGTPRLRSVPRRMEWTAVGLALLTVLMGVRATEILALLEIVGGPPWR